MHDFGVSLNAHHFFPYASLFRGWPEYDRLTGMPAIFSKGGAIRQNTRKTCACDSNFVLSRRAAPAHKNHFVEGKPVKLFSLDGRIWFSKGA